MGAAEEATDASSTSPVWSCKSCGCISRPLPLVPRGWGDASPPTSDLRRVYASRDRAATGSRVSRLFEVPTLTIVRDFLRTGAGGGTGSAGRCGADWTAPRVGNAGPEGAGRLASAAAMASGDADGLSADGPAAFTRSGAAGGSGAPAAAAACAGFAAAAAVCWVAVLSSLSLSASFPAAAGAAGCANGGAAGFLAAAAAGEAATAVGAEGGPAGALGAAVGGPEGAFGAAGAGGPDGA